MRYSTFEEAAVEASTGVKEIDAEIERLMAKRDALDTLVRQLSAVLPMIADAGSAGKSGSASETPAEPFSRAEGLAEARPYPVRKEEWPSYAPAGAETEAPAAMEQPSFTDLLSQGNSYSLRHEGWPASSPSDQRGIRERL